MFGENGNPDANTLLGMRPADIDRFAQRLLERYGQRHGFAAPVNFHGFARLFRDHLGTPNALYLDGVVSRRGALTHFGLAPLLC
jgi:hypothetical protein